MTSYPVFFSITRPERFDRAQVALRLLILAVFSIVGITMGALFGLLYLALPLFAAIAVSTKGGRRFLDEDGPRFARGIRWVMSAYAYMMLLTDHLPSSPEDDVRLAIEPGAWSAPGPSTGSALLRLITSLPSAFVLGLLGLVSWVVWLVAAVMILVTEDYPAALHAFQCGVLRWQARLFAYHASLTEPYPPFAFDASPLADVGGERWAH
ncbi:MAG: DUF4389 domain-containing protein [Minicystis sp.]